MTYYVGKITRLLLDFDMIDLSVDDAPNLDWSGGYKPYVPPN